MKKKLALITTSAIVVGALSVGAYATVANDFAFSNQGVISVTEGTDGESMVLFQVDENGTEMISVDGGKTFEEFTALDDENLEHTIITEEDVQKEIDEVKANLNDTDFMSDWAQMGKTKQDMLDYISTLENQLKDIESGMVFTAVSDSETIEDTFDIMTATNENIEVTEQFSLAFELENGEMDVIQANSKDELLDKLEALFENKEISQAQYDDILKSLD